MKKSKILVLQGVPASGKSSWARKFVKENQSWVIVNRDTIRKAFGDDYKPNDKFEEYVNLCELNEVSNALGCGFNVIIDATNLNPKTLVKWEDLALSWNAEIEYKEFMVSYKEAVERDSKRENPVGEKVIKRFFRKYYPDKLMENSIQTISRKRVPYNGRPKAVLCDIDGTLAWMQNRSPFDYTKVLSDKYDERLVDLLLNLQKQDIKIIFVSGREGTRQCVDDTCKWLGKRFGGFIFYHRMEKDYRPDEIVKEELYHSVIEPYYDVVCVFDDRNKVVDMWRNLGLLCCQVWYGDF